MAKDKSHSMDFKDLELECDSIELAGTAVTSTAAELNILDGVTASAAEINRVADTSSRVTATTSTALSLTVADHAEGVILISSNSSGASTITLPEATGSGIKITLIHAIAQTQGTIVIAAKTTDTMTGTCLCVNTTATAGVVACDAFFTSATSDKITTNAGTKGGILGGDIMEFWDTADTTWTVKAITYGAGAVETPFSQT